MTETNPDPPQPEKLYRLRALEPTDRNWIAERLDDFWGSTRIVSRGNLHYAHTLPGFTVVDEDDTPHGLVTYNIMGRDCEIVTLNSFTEGIGVGSALIDAVKDAAKAEKCKRVWLITSNDNMTALAYWQKRGFELVAVHRGAITEARRLKPEIPLLGDQDIPVRDEIELELPL
jgi:ribosomal protein S18 acetylase RimI-like enzyme